MTARTPAQQRRKRARFALERAAVEYGDALARNGREPELGCAISYDCFGIADMAEIERSRLAIEQVEIVRDKLKLALERYVRAARGKGK